MRTLLVSGTLIGLGLLPWTALAAPLDGSVPVLCAASSVVECTHKGECARSTADDASVPQFVRVDVGKRMLSSVDGARTSPISAVQRTNGRLMIQGMQNERVWGAVIEEQTGMMTATIGEDDGAIVISGTCIVP
ncbi:MAG TPA: hypothetical protein VEL75_22070 [Candidatus Methylomirabilis sp.]|nr:hypothetical protein [Candidatus Methylomirabilis sp.]